MNRMPFLSLLVVLMVAFGCGVAMAEVIEMSPTQAVVAADVSGPTRVLLQFDLSAIPESVVLDDARLDWTVSGIDGETPMEFAAYAAGAAWTVAGVAENALPEVSEEPVAAWEITPMDYARTGGLVRFQIRDLANAWVSGALANHGLMLEMADLGSRALAAQIAQVRLTVRFARE